MMLKIKHAKKQIIQRGLSTSGLVLTLLCSTPVVAESKANMDVAVTEVPTIYVESNGKQYTELSRKKHILGLYFKARVSITTKTDRRINKWKMGLKLSRLGLTFGENVGSTSRDVTEGMGTHQESYTYKKKRKRPSTVFKEVDLFVRRDYINQFAIDICNAQASYLRSQGSSNNSIFSHNHTLTLASDAYTSVHTTYVEEGASFDTASGLYLNSKDVKIVCQKHRPTAQAGDLQIGTGVTQTSLTIIEQSTIGGACKVNLSTVIKTNLPNTTVKYRFEHENGRKSDIKTVTTSHTKTAMDAHWYNVPSNNNGRETGRIRIKGVSHNFTSAWKTYDMNCREAGTSTLSLVTKPIVRLNLKPSHNVLHQGKLCPTKIKITATLTSAKNFEGTGVVSMKNGNYGFATHDVNLSPNITWRYEEMLDLKPWGNTNNGPSGLGGGSQTFQTQPGQGSSTPSQRFSLRYSLSANNQNVVQTPYKTIVVRCTTAQVNPHLSPTQNNGLTNSTRQPSIQLRHSEKKILKPHLKRQPTLEPRTSKK